LPCRLAMATVARFPETSLMRIGRLMTVEAASGRVAELYRLRVTTDALHGLVGVPELEIRKCVIERLAIQQDDIGVPPLVIGMTVGAFLFHCVRLTPVKPFARRTVRGNLLVTRKAEPRLRSPRERLVTIAAFLLKFGMSADDRSRKDEPFKKVLRSRGRCDGACDNDADHERTCQSPAQWRVSTQ